MAGISTEEFGQEGSFEGNSSEQQPCQFGEALAEWRSSEQVGNGSPSTCCESDDNDDGGPKPSELFGKFTWKIEKYSQITKRELRSNPFEIGGYKWYILIYPQGCDVCNHLSLFLCVANHDKLLPGWSHFAQFTIAVVNKDPKKSKYSDTLHRFWKKEHDWGWKKFMELSKVFDGFLDADALIIKAQVQVIREKIDRPFRCLEYHYRRELVRVYLTNVEQICRRFVEERRSKLGKLLEDKARWSSFCAFWLGMDQSSRRRMSREKTESILKVVIKHFFIEKEVTSTLVMDSLYSGLKALEGQNKGKKTKCKHVVAEEVPLPIIRIEKDTFILVDDMLQLLERAAMEPLPPKDDKGPQNRKDGTAGEEFNKDSVEHDEGRLTDLGRRTIEIFVLAHIFSKIEVAYQEAVALKKQEELIREEEAAWLAETEQKARRVAADKEKKAKKKQGKQKRNNRKGKEKGKEDKASSNVPDKIEQACLSVEGENLATEHEMVFEKSDAIGDVSDASDSVECVPEVRAIDSEDREASPVNWDTDASEACPPTEASGSWVSRSSVVQNGIERKSSAADDSLSTSSSESIPSATMPEKGNSHNRKNQKTANRGRNHQGKSMSDRADLVNEEPSVPSGAVTRARQPNGASQNSQTVQSVHDHSVIKAERKVEKKDEETASSPRNIRANDAVNQKVSGDKIAHVTSLSKSPSISVPPVAPPILESKINSASSTVVFKKPSADGPKRHDGSIHLTTSAEDSSTLKSEPPKSKGPKHSEKPSGHQMPIGKDKARAQEVPGVPEKSLVPPAPVMSRPLSAPLAPDPRPAVTVISMAHTAPALARSMSATGRLGPEATAPGRLGPEATAPGWLGTEATASLAPGYVPQSYRNAIMGVPAAGGLSAYSLNHSASAAVNGLSHSYSQAPVLASAPPFPPHSDRVDLNPNKSGLFGLVNQHMMQNGPLGGRKSPADSSSLINGGNYSLFNHDRRLQNPVPTDFQACTSGRQGHGLQDEFPHLDIINELLEDEHVVGAVNSGYQNFGNATHNLNRHYSFPGELNPSTGLGPSASSCRFDRSRSYHSDLLKHLYGVPGQSYDTLRDMNLQPRVNGQVDGFMANQQWQMAVGSDVPYLNTRNVDGESFPYHIPEYQNLNVGMNGYPMFRPSNGL